MSTPGSLYILSLSHDREGHVETLAHSKRGEIVRAVYPFGAAVSRGGLGAHGLTTAGRLTARLAHHAPTIWERDVVTTAIRPRQGRHDPEREQGGTEHEIFHADSLVRGCSR